jgi:hypothetical protein
MSWKLYSYNARHYHIVRIAPGIVHTLWVGNVDDKEVCIVFNNQKYDKEWVPLNEIVGKTLENVIQTFFEFGFFTYILIYVIYGIYNC